MKKLLTVCMMLALVASAAWAGASSLPTIGMNGKDAAKVEQKVTEQPTSIENQFSSLDDCAIPFPESVETAVVPALPACWIQISADALAPTWRTYNTLGAGHSGTKYFGITYSDPAPQLDDWLLSPAVTLTGGSSYNFKFWRKAYSSSFAERLDVWYGSTQDVAGMTNNLIATHTFTSTTWTQETATFTPASSGTYYFGFHATSVQAYYLLIDDVELASANAVGRCCYLQGGIGTCGDNYTEPNCTALGGQWGGENSTCANNPCPIARCCYLDANHYGQCTDNMQLECTAMGGTWTAGMTCAANPCAVGRCCYSSGACATNQQGECTYFGGTWTAGLTCATPCPVNVSGGETCATAVALPGVGSYLSTTADNLDDDPAVYCSDPQGSTNHSNTAKDEWFTVVGTGNTMEINTCGVPSFDTQLGVYCGDCNAPTCVAGNDDMSPGCPSGSYRSKVTFCSELGRLYYVIVDGYSTDNGPYSLNVLDDGVPCSGYVQCEAVGRCCYLSGGAAACADLTAGQCANLGGLWGGAGTSCTTSECPTGRCCYGDVCAPTCVDRLTELECGVFGGTWTVDGSCDPDGCPILYPCYCTCSVEANTHCALGTPGQYPIMDGVWLYVPISVPMEYHITDVNVCFDITHTWDADVQMFLVHPDGMTFVELCTGNGGSGDNFICTALDDQAGTLVTAGVAPFTGSYIPEFPLAGFNGMNAIGTWTLAIYDNGVGDTGTLNYVCLSFQYDYILPVTGVSFDAVPGNNSITLNWSTASETNMSHFEVMRGAEKVAEVACTNSATGHNYNYVDNDVTNGVAYSYTLVGVDLDGSRGELATVNASPSANGVVTEYALLQNFPNPFNPETNIAFDMVEAGHVNISIYNVIGQKVAELVNGSMTSGRHIVSFDAASLPSGLYLYKMEANGFSAQKKMVLMK